MIQSFLAKILLAPVSLLYGLGISLRDFFYRKGVLKGISFNLPVISIGNLSVGGAGKTPHIEYLIRLLKDYINVSTLSRGYKRKTKGFLFVHGNMTAEQVGDEPLQYKRKYPEVMVAVSESRSLAIPQIVMSEPDMQVVLLDDAFQHRSVQPGLNILLTEYSHPFTRDFLLPSGRLREWRSAYQRADVIIVSKCPLVMELGEKEAFIEEIKPQEHQRMFFSYYDYYRPYYIFDGRYTVDLKEDWDVILICAIARTDYLVEHLEERVNSVHVLEFEDHHFFSKYDIAHLKTVYDNMESQNKIILTTEKDAMRLELHKKFITETNLPLFALPVEVKFHYGEGPDFDEDVRKFMLEFKV